MIRPTLEEAQKLAPGYTILPLSLEIFSDMTTPIEMLRTMRQHSECWYILESVNSADSWGRYTFLGYQPVMTVFKENGSLMVRSKDQGTVKKSDAAAGVSPLTALRDMIAHYKSPLLSYLPPFTGGFVGYFAYESARDFIPGLKLNAGGTEDSRDFHLMLMDKVIAFDHFKQKIYLMANIPAEDLENSYARGVAELEDMAQVLLAPFSPPEQNRSILPMGSHGAHGAYGSHGSHGAYGSHDPFTASFSEDTFKDRVEKIKGHITEGDIFQAVLSNRFQAAFQGDLLDTYRILRTTNPSPYMVYMRLEDTEIACSSPETLVSVHNAQVHSFPLAGSRPRGVTAQEDKALIEDLLQDEKELAEHDMLVDLARNDIGKVCRFGSVQLQEYRQVKRFSHISHIASHVTGDLDTGQDALDVLAATLPAGTLSGAPKKRACEIIDDVEGLRRGIYGGGIGYIDFAGNMDMCIGIRMAVLKNNTVSVQTGAGIVDDSVPEKEYQETLTKARPVMEALKNSGGLTYDTHY
ncbi:MAG: anthranilate synthase component I family protein [Peptococcaceae bacterium]|nr:anthranilate synthase component I family protein [Peptococcaceae bacterium]